MWPHRKPKSQTPLTKGEMQNTLRLIRGFRSGKLTYKELLKQAPPLYSAKEFALLLDLIEHQPAKDGFLAHPREHDEYEKDIIEEIERLSRSCEETDQQLP